MSKQNYKITDEVQKLEEFKSGLYNYSSDLNKKRMALKKKEFIQDNIEHMITELNDAIHVMRS